MSFKRFDPQDLVPSVESVTSTCWSNNNPILTTFYTSSNQVASIQGDYYYDVYQTQSTNAESAVQFDIVYCDSDGSGSAFYNNLVTGSSPSRTMYGQYRTMCLGDEEASFIFGNVTSSYFFALSIERARYKETIFPGSMNLILSGGGLQTLHLTDNSNVDLSRITNEAGRVFQLISGSNGYAYTGSGFAPNSSSYGWVLPDVGTILLDGATLQGGAGSGGLNMTISRSFDVNGQNPKFLYRALRGGNSFGLNSQESIASNYIFVRARNSEFNYSGNPSFISGSTGELIYPLFVESPQTYITSIGLYNDSNELCAVAKLSRPLLKDFTKELLVRVKLDF